ncbi:MAG: HTTM domain-containing protein [Planctomycetaceae bacterium]|nr:HTTM domain-containing protein [Planctomycetaceae bacterium]
MNLFTNYIRDLFQGTLAGWNRFWFSAVDPATLGAIRLCTGAMLFYTHLVWTLGINDFLMPGGWLDPAAVRMTQRGGFAWSYWWYIQSPTLIWVVHLAGLVVFAMLALGLFSRIVSVLAFVITVSYTHRLTGALFGLDQINAMLAMYLMVGPSGAAYSLDRWRLARKEDVKLPPAPPSVGANLALRLIQIHMCVIYFFAGVSKLQGPAWWEGSALWGAVANLEYQSFDMTWLAAWPLTIAFLTHVTVLWEISYPALVWPRLTRPIVLAMAVPLHLGIAFGLGMMTFGIAMLFGNLAFVSPKVVRAVLGGGPPPKRSKPAAEKAAEKGSERPPERSGDRPNSQNDAAFRAQQQQRDRMKRSSSMS